MDDRMLIEVFLLKDGIRIQQLRISFKSNSRKLIDMKEEYFPPSFRKNVEKLINEFKIQYPEIWVSNLEDMRLKDFKEWSVI